MSRFFATFPGEPYPLGATLSKKGVNFAIFSEHATSVELLLFTKNSSKKPFKTILLDPVSNRTANIWHIFVGGITNNNFYAYRVDGPSGIELGHHFNPKKILTDPYAKGTDYSLFRKEDTITEEDDIESSLRSAIVQTSNFNWEGDKPLKMPLEDTIVYELHIGNFTKSPSSKCRFPGKFEGLIEKIPYLKSLGITAVELMPVFDFTGGKDKNVWGYGTSGFFAPDSRYCLKPNDFAGHFNDFRRMVKALHRAGIEVILDVVLGYTIEAGKDGPILNFKGLDNSIYYQLPKDDKTEYINLSGCGNTLNCNHPVVSKFILDCLEFWAFEMHVDGFRFDEATLLSRDENGEITSYPHMLWNIDRSEKLADTKLIAEPWDAAGGYLLGKFPGYRFLQWNDKFRDKMRCFVRGDRGILLDIMARMSGSEDLFKTDYLFPRSLNFISAHDGFTMMDIVSYAEKHNWDNGEDNRDGFDFNYSDNNGIEGETTDATINLLRMKQLKNFFMLLLLSRGVPMITMGDEVGRTQNGNNNAYCQDSAITWFDWSLVRKNAELLHFVQKIINFRHQEKHFRQSEMRFFDHNLSDPLADPAALSLSVLIGDKYCLLINMEPEIVEFQLPENRNGWLSFLNTAQKDQNFSAEFLQKEYVTLAPKSIALFVAG